jgi:CheY-like chemotaxis protein
VTIAALRTTARVLVVDDDVETVINTSLFLEMQGCEVKKAYSGVQAIAEATRFCPDATLLDVGMSDIDCYQLAGRLRDIPCLDEGLLIAITGNALWPGRRRCAEAGFDLSFPKPVDFTLLEQTLWLIQESRRLQESFLQRTCEQKAAFVTLINSTLEMAETFMNIAITTRNTEVKARVLDKVQKTYVRMREMVKHVDEPMELVHRIEAVKQRYDLLLYRLR